MRSGKILSEQAKLVDFLVGRLSQEVSAMQSNSEEFNPENPNAEEIKRLLSERIAELSAKLSALSQTIVTPNEATESRPYMITPFFGEHAPRPKPKLVGGFSLTIPGLESASPPSTSIPDSEPAATTPIQEVTIVDRKPGVFVGFTPVEAPLSMAIHERAPQGQYGKAMADAQLGFEHQDRDLPLEPTTKPSQEDQLVDRRPGMFVGYTPVGAPLSMAIHERAPQGQYGQAMADAQVGFTTPKPGGKK